MGGSHGGGDWVWAERPCRDCGKPIHTRFTPASRGSRLDDIPPPEACPLRRCAECASKLLQREGRSFAPPVRRGRPSRFVH